MRVEYEGTKRTLLLAFLFCLAIITGVWLGFLASGRSGPGREPAVNEVNENAPDVFLELCGEEQARGALAAEDDLYCPLCGEKCAGEVLQPPLAVLFDNSLHAVGTKGMGDADVIYEVLVEGGITRYLAIYHCRLPEVTGPVRSARPYLVQLAYEHGAAFVHAGGSGEALALIRDMELVNFDEIAGSPGFYRDSDSRPPHNLYALPGYLVTKAEMYRDAGPVRNFGNLSGGDLPPAESFSIPYWGGYTVSYRYDPKQGAYLRYAAGSPHEDSGKQLAPANVIVQKTRTVQIDSVGRLEVVLTGAGKGLLFREGRKLRISWEKPALDEPTRFYLADGSPAPLKAGQTFVQIVPLEVGVELK